MTFEQCEGLREKLYGVDYLANCIDSYQQSKPAIYEPLCEKTGLRGFRPGPTQTRLYSHRRWLDARNFGFRK